MTQVQEEQVELQPEVEVAEAPELEIVADVAEEEAPVITEQKKAFDPKTDRVDFSTPEQEAKFNYVYKQTKMSDARNAMLTDMLQTQQAQLDELKARFSNTDSADAERMLLNKVMTARNSGDDAAEIMAINELVDFKADKKMSSAKSQQPQAPQQTAPDVNYVANLIAETDDNGAPVRPWLNETHKDYDTVVEMLETQIAPKYRGDPLFLQKAMFELDQIMRNKMTEQKTPSQTMTRAPNPMQGSNLTNVSKKPTIKMTRQEMEIAKKLGVDPKKYAARRDAELSKGKR